MGVSTISRPSNGPTWSRPKEPRKRATASATAAPVRRPSDRRSGQLSDLAITRRSHRLLRPADGRGEEREGDEREEPGDVEEEPVREDDLEADEEGGGQRGELERRLTPRHERDDHGRCEDDGFQRRLERREVRVAGVLVPVPERERRVAAELPAERPVPEDAGGVQRVGLEQEDPEAEHGGEDEPAAEEDERARAAKTVRVGGPERDEQKRRELRPRGEPDGEPPRWRRGDEPEAEDEDRWQDRVVRVRAGDVLRVRVGGPREGQRGREASTAEPPADEREADQGEAVEEERGEVRCRKRVPLAAPAVGEVAGDVHDVRDRPVRVAAVVRGL